MRGGLGRFLRPTKKEGTPTTQRQRILICSGSSGVQFPTMVNHATYAAHHGYRYRFNVNPYPNLPNIYYHKLATLMDSLQDADWVFWLDDDAAFMQTPISLEDLVPEMKNPQYFAIYCRSPMNRGIKTLLSAGNFLIRNCPASFQFLEDCIRTTENESRSFWDEDAFGPYWGPFDQEAMIFQIMRSAERQNAVALLEYTRFNTRPFHFGRVDDHFLVHFTHEPDRSKKQQMADFAARFGLSDFLLPHDLIEPYEIYLPYIRNTVGL